MIKVAFQMNYGFELPPEEEWVWVYLDGRYGGTPADVHSHVVQLFQREAAEVLIIDAEGDVWSFIPETVSMFVTHDR